MKALILGTLLLANAVMPQSGRQLLDEAITQSAAFPYFTRIDTNDRLDTMDFGGRRVALRPKHSELVVAIDRPSHVARGSTTINGQPVELLQRGKATVMRVGDEPWAPSAGSIGDTVWNLDDLPVWDGLFSDRDTATPDWNISGQQVLDGQEAIVVSADGPATIRLVEKLTNQLVATVFSGTDLPTPTTKVLDYACRHWLTIKNHRRLQVKLTYQTVVTTRLKDHATSTLETTITQTSRYQYDTPPIDIPAEADAVLRTIKTDGD